MIFKNNADFPLFWFFSFVNSFKFFSKQVNVTEVEVSVEIEQ